jgi:hypothetical protein
MSSCGVSKGDLLELLLVDIEWSNHGLAIIDLIKFGGDKISIGNDLRVCEKDGSMALSWALVNAVRLSHSARHLMMSKVDI